MYVLVVGDEVWHERSGGRGREVWGVGKWLAVSLCGRYNGFWAIERGAELS